MVVSRCVWSIDSSPAPQLATESRPTADASAVERLIEARFAGRKHFNVMKYGAKRDAKSDDSCTVAARSTTLGCTNQDFKAADVGKVISIKGAAADQRQLITVIAGYIDPEHVALRDESAENVSRTGIIWGTDNLTAFQSALNAAAGQRLVFPLGAFLVKVSTKAQLEVPSDTVIFQEKGGALYMVGVSGTPSGDAGVRLFHLPENTHDVLFDGLYCKGENSPYTVIPMNQSECIGGIGFHPESLRDITVMHSSFENLYGFSVHDAGTGMRIDAIANYFSHTSKGLNINADYSVQMYNHFEEDGGMESGGAHSVYDRNIFRRCSGQYTLSLGGRTGSPAGTGTVARGNDIENPAPRALGAIAASNGFSEGEISGNTITGLSGAQIGIVMIDNGYPASADNNVIARNTIIGAGSSKGVYVANVKGTKLIGNKVEVGLVALLVSGGNNTESTSNSWSGKFQDIYVKGTGNLRVHGDWLANGVFVAAGDVTFAPDSQLPERRRVSSTQVR